MVKNVVAGLSRVGGGVTDIRSPKLNQVDRVLVYSHPNECIASDLEWVVVGFKKHNCLYSLLSLLLLSVAL